MLWERAVILLVDPWGIYAKKFESLCLASVRSFLYPAIRKYSIAG